MADKRIKLDIELATKQAQSNLKAAAKEAKALGDEVDDTRSAGKKLADAMNQVTDALEQELKDSAKAADKLAKALGPDMVDDLKASGRSVDDLVANLRAAGLSYEEVEADADALADAMRRANQVGDEVKTHITKNLDDVADRSDKARDATHNFVGNAVSEIPLVGETFGPLGEAVGQLTEGLLAGEVGFGGLIAAAAPIAGIALGFKVITDVMAENDRRVAAHKKRVEDLTKAYATARNEGTSLAEEIAKSWEDNGGKIEVEISNDTATLLEFGEATDDLGKIHDLVYPTAKRRVEDFSDELDNMNLTAEQFATLAQQPIDQIKVWGEEMVAAGYDAAEVNKIMQGAVGLHGDLAAAAENDARMVRLFGKDAAEAATGVDKLKTSTEKLDTAYQRLMGHLDEQDAWQSYQEALWAASDGVGNAEEDTRNLTRATADLVQAMEDVPEETKAQIIVALDRGKQAEVDAWLAEKAKGITVPFYTVVSGQRGNKDTGFQYATGTNFAQGGVALVGEDGPELVDLPTGAKVRTATDTERILQSAQQQPTYVDQRVFNVMLPTQTPESLHAELERYHRRNGLT